MWTGDKSMNDTETQNLIQALFEMAIEQRKTTQALSDLVQRIDVLSTLLINGQKKSNGGILNRENWPQTVFSLVVLVVLALILIFKGGCSAQPDYFYLFDSDSDPLDSDSDSDPLDSDSDSDPLDSDNDSDSLDSDNDSDPLDSDLLDTDISCPWICTSIKKSDPLQTCDPDWDHESEPISIRNYNYRCSDDELCCQPWPDESGGIESECPDRCQMNCVQNDKIDNNYGCFHPFTKCCIGGKNAKGIKDIEKSMVLGDMDRSKNVFSDGTQ